MSENLLQLAVEDLFGRLHQALVSLQVQSVHALSRTVEQRWAFAVARRERDETRVLCGKLLEVAATAAALSEEHGVVMVTWNQRWLTLSEVGELVLAADADSATREDRDRLRSFGHAETVILFLQSRRITASGEIQSHLEEKGVRLSPQACWNHLHRLSKMGIVLRVKGGVYRLSLRGREIARLLVQEKKAAAPREPVFFAKTYTELDAGAASGRPGSGPRRGATTSSPRELVAAGMKNLVQHGVISLGAAKGRDAGPSRADAAPAAAFLDEDFQPVQFGL